MLLYDIFVQSLAIAALVGFILSFQFKSRTRILITQGISLFVWGIHFSLLNAWTGAVLDFINAVKIYLFVYRRQNKWLSSNKTLYLFIAIFWIFGVLTWEGSQSLLPIVGVTISTIATWQIKSRKIRLVFAPSTLLWLAYDFIVGSYGSMIAEAVIFISILLGIKRLDKSKK